MSLISTDEFLNLLRRSKIVEAESLEKAIHFLQAQGGGELVSEVPRLADQLVELGLITQWQSEKLLARRYKGFFLGRYKLLEQIGSGGMSRVFLAEHQMLHRRRALKVLPRERVRDSTYLARFQLEARAIAALDHPNIVRAYDIDSVGDIHYLVMEYIEGPDLQQLVQEQGPLDYLTAAHYIAQAARGLHHAHQAGLIHRDVKPANVLLDPQQVVKVLDLGLALFHEITDDASLTITHNEKVLGTADYLAPEQALDSHSIDHRADLYGLGCTLYFALTGAPPFPDGSIAQRIARHQSRMPPPLSTHRADCPAELEAICFRLLQKRPEDRYESAIAVAEALEAFIRSETADAGTRPSWQQAASATVPSARLPLVISAAAPGSGFASPSSCGPGTGSPSQSGGAGDSQASLPRRPRPDDTLADKARDTVKGLPVPDRAQPDRAQSERAQSERAQSERAQSERAQSERAQSDRAQSDRAQPDRAQSERAQSERASPTSLPDLGESPRPGGPKDSVPLETAGSENARQVIEPPIRHAPGKEATRRPARRHTTRRLIDKIRKSGNRLRSWCTGMALRCFSRPESGPTPSTEARLHGRWLRSSFGLAFLVSLLVLVLYATLRFEWLFSWPPFRG